MPTGAQLEFRLNVDDEGRADRGEQTSLGTWPMSYSNKVKAIETHENQGGVEVLIVLQAACVRRRILPREWIKLLKRGVLVIVP